MKENSRSGGVSKKKVPEIPCEKPHQNGSKPAEISKIPEETKKHIRRDGKK